MIGYDIDFYRGNPDLMQPEALTPDPEARQPHLTLPLRRSILHFFLRDVFLPWKFGVATGN